MKAIGKNIDGKVKEFKNYNNSIYCSDNQLTELVLPNGVEKVYCSNNPIKELTLPKNIRLAYLPLNCIVLNIDEFKNNDKVKIFFR